MNIYNIYSCKKLKINYPDIYFTPEYGICCEYSDNAKWQICIYKDLIFCYLLKKNIVITPYGYSGLYYKYKTTFEDFIPKFVNLIKKFGIKEIIIRQNPYFDNKLLLDNYFKIINEKTLFYINISSIDEYKKTLKSSQKNKINKAKKENLKYKIKKFEQKDINEFVSMYTKLMNKLSATKYYYFNSKYFLYLTKLKESNYIKIYNNYDNVIGLAIYFVYKEYIHFHLSCNNGSYSFIQNFLLYSLANEYVNKKIILGCGLNENDNLHKFKKSVSNKNVKYKIYKYSIIE